jgi:hypothetical protein
MSSNNEDLNQRMAREAEEHRRRCNDETSRRQEEHRQRCEQRQQGNIFGSGNG